MKIRSFILAVIALSTLFLAPAFLVRNTISDFTHCDPDEYNAWADGDGNGKIDIFDVVYVTSKYNTNGCATKTLNITNWPDYFYPPYPNEMNITNWPLDEEDNLKVSIDGTPSGLHTDETEITILDWTDTHDFSGGIYIYQDSISCLIPFIFSPSGELVNVTDLWIFINEKVEENVGNVGYTIKINNASTVSAGTKFANRHVLTSRTLHFEDSSVCQLIGPGVNTLEFSGLGSNRFVYLYRITLIIEYEYLV